MRILSFPRRFSSNSRGLMRTTQSILGKKIPYHIFQIFPDASGARHAVGNRSVGQNRHLKFLYRLPPNIDANRPSISWLFSPLVVAFFMALLKFSLFTTSAGIRSLAAPGFK